MSNIPSDLFYTKEHEWLKVDGENVLLGITDFAQSSLGDIVFVELPDSGEAVEAEASFGVVESIKSVSDLYSPVHGSVVEKNAAVEETPEKINEGPYDSWLIKIKLTDQDSVKSLMSAEDYQKFCENEA